MQHTTGRIRAAHEILETATRFTEKSLVPLGYALLLGALLELGEIRSLDVELLEDRVDAAGLRGVPYTNPALWFRCLRLILDGDVTLAEQHAQAMYEQSPQEGTVAQALYTSQLGLIR